MELKGVKFISSSRGSDGHSLAVTTEGQAYSWGEGLLLLLLLLLFELPVYSRGC